MSTAMFCPQCRYERSEEEFSSHQINGRTVCLRCKVKADGEARRAQWATRKPCFSKPRPVAPPSLKDQAKAMPIKALVDEVVAQSANPDCIERELLESSLGIWRSRFGMKKGLEIWRRGLEKLWMEGKLMGPVRKLTLAEMEQD